MTKSNGMRLPSPSMEEQDRHDGGANSGDEATPRAELSPAAAADALIAAQAAVAAPAAASPSSPAHVAEKPQIQIQSSQPQAHAQAEQDEATTPTNSAPSPPSDPPPEAPQGATEHSAAASLRSAFSANVVNPGGTVRAVTPDMTDGQSSTAPSLTLDGNSSTSRAFSSSQQSSPRSVPSGVNRRQGIVFQDSNDQYETPDPSPPLPPRHGSGGTVRPRTRTLEATMLAQRSAPPGPEQRHRVSSMSSSGSQPGGEDQRPQAPSIESVGYPSVQPGRHLEPAVTSSPRDTKKSPSKRLLKRQSSRPTSPVMPQTPSLDSLPIPLAVSDPYKIILLMQTLCGRMRGEIEYQGESAGPWYPGVAYIDEDKACLMFDSGQNGPFHIPLVSDLKGCRVLPVDHPDVDKLTIELVSAHPVVEIVLRPMVPEEFDLWLAALLCWQQVKPNGVQAASGGPVNPAAPVRPELKRHGTSENSKGRNIIKVGKVRLWDKGLPTSARVVVKRSSTRDQRSSVMSWRRMSCILQDNGNFKLLTESDSAVASILEISQLSRRAIQQLDRSVLDEEHCIAILPIYAASASSLSIFRPVFLALDTQTNFEVWFALLRALAKPDVFKLDNPKHDKVQEATNLEDQHEGEVFRVERTVGIRVTEAKIKAVPSGAETGKVESRKKSDSDPTIGNYLAEVVLDGEVRARTILKTATNNPFWREDCEFNDLPPTIPFLSIVLKKVEGSAEMLSNYPSQQQQGPSSQGKSGNATELTWGSMEISLEQFERGKDNEQWHQILDDKQQSIGSMLLKVTYDEHAVLLEKEYKDLSDMLHRFTSGITTQISGILPGQLRRLAELFLNIFQVSGSASDWLMALVEDEIDGIGNQASINKKYRFNNRLKSNESAESSSDRELIVRDMSKSLAGEANLLFRGNSLLTQSLEFHMRRLGKEYLEEILQEKIWEINEVNPDCEVDPSKLHHTGGDLEQHWNHLIALTTEVWQSIAESAKRIPPELRHILKYIRAVAEDRYGDFLRTVRYTAVSGFLFLRFICPAILSPKLFGLLRDHPRQRAQRTLTFVAKALQKMANLSTFGKREEWMEPMNRFLNAQRPVFRDFIDQVCSIPADQNANPLQASYSTPITILGRLGPTAKEGFPSLPYLIDQPRNFAGLVKLWAEANPMATKSSQIEGELVEFNSLCFSLQRRADACLDKMESVRAAEASSRGISDELAETLEQASLIESLNFSYHGPPSAASGWPSSAAGDSDRPPGSSGSDIADDNPNNSNNNNGGGNGNGSGANRRRTSREVRRGREAQAPGGGGESKKLSGLRQVSGVATGTIKGTRNGKVGRTILSGLMRISGRGESPDGKASK